MATFDTKTILAIATAMIDKYGYIKNKDWGEDVEYSTKKYTITCYNILTDGEEQVYPDAEDWYPTKEELYADDFKDILDKVGPEEFKATEIMIDWIKNKEINPNDKLARFYNNLKRVASKDEVTDSEVGILVCLPYMYNKDKKYENEHKEEIVANNNSEYIGNEGDKITVNIKSYSIGAKYKGKYGVSVCYKFIDDNDNILTWWTSEKTKFPENGVTKISAVVKGHKEFRGIKQTDLKLVKAI